MTTLDEKNAFPILLNVLHENTFCPTTRFEENDEESQSKFLSGEKNKKNQSSTNHKKLNSGVGEKKKARFEETEEEAQNRLLNSEENSKNNSSKDEIQNKNLLSSSDKKEKKASFKENDENEEASDQKTKFLVNSEEEKKDLENGGKPKKKIMFAEEEKNEELANKKRSCTNFQKQSIQNSFELNSIQKPRSKSCDSGKLELESQNQEIDEMFEALANFHALRLNKKYFFF